jgi:hypothetical protein
MNGRKEAQKREAVIRTFFEPFAPFCGQMPFFLNENAARILEARISSQGARLPAS